MRIQSIHIKNYRSIEDASIENCGDLNVFIGKNNAGKSNLLSTIFLATNHLKAGKIVQPWAHGRVRDQFTDKDPSRSLQIGLRSNYQPK